MSNKNMNALIQEEEFMFQDYEYAMIWSENEGKKIAWHKESWIGPYRILTMLDV